jgi:hypothetical protein
MNTKVSIITFLFTLILFNCKNDTALSEYKYSDKPIVLNCNNLNSKLYNEALYSFENDILNYYGGISTKKSLLRAYSQFIRYAVYDRVNYSELMSEHSLKVFEALKNDKTLWDVNNSKSHLNYSSPLFKCIAENITDQDLQKTLNALLTTNSMSPKLFGAPLLTRYKGAETDKALASYIAFDLYYSKFFDIDLSKVNFDKPQTPVDFNKVPQKPINGPLK